VGPEPTTDRFMAVMYGGDERLVPGHALAMQVSVGSHSVVVLVVVVCCLSRLPPCSSTAVRKLSTVADLDFLLGGNRRISHFKAWQVMETTFLPNLKLLRFPHRF